jgi:hypothetical protein
MPRTGRMSRKVKMRIGGLKEYATLLILVLSSPLLGGQCKIHILNKKNSGEIINLQFTSRLNSKRQCQMLAQMHRPNFNPTQIRLKTVNYQWMGSRSKTVAVHKKKKRSSSVAKIRKARKRHSSPQF